MEKNIIIKIGSGVLITKRNKLNKFRISHIANQISTLINHKIGIILVISGAVAKGANFIKISQNRTKMAAAGIGQIKVISTFDNIFTKKKLQIAQILLTQEMFKSKINRQKLNKLLKFYLKHKIVPIINENDVVDLNCFKGNDYLAAKIAILLKADKLLILSTRKGSPFGVGGGKSKIDVISFLRKKKIIAEVVDGKRKNIILKSIL